MKNKKLLIAISFIVGLFLLALVSSKFAAMTTRPETSSERKAKKILYYRAPMNPTYISDRPGKSPMGMDLIPVYEGEDETSPGEVKINPVVVQNMGVRTAMVRRGKLEKSVYNQIWCLRRLHNNNTCVKRIKK